ncbi:TfoX/Sxy family protein [Streptomyces cupreus]|uniref:TfoX/Sxy family protein n=1 Tax=Streptomyces cupreus TaxID=2759956 RepID=A0A7X1J723_9ACTN|nr:TfoX/Sxy family protein [Streptomyces cupreus]MBC2904805.1 TfoX/Sxy family protein [Streptomyces cupreus]
MPYDETLAQRVREALPPAPDLGERKMFGGLAFLLGGHMFCGVVRDELMVRLGEEGAVEALQLPGVRPMDFTGRPVKSMVFVTSEALAGSALDDWVARAVAHARALPPKTAAKPGG